MLPTDLVSTLVFMLNVGHMRHVAPQVHSHNPSLVIDGWNYLAQQSLSPKLPDFNAANAYDMTACALLLDMALTELTVVRQDVRLLIGNFVDMYTRAMRPVQPPYSSAFKEALDKLLEHFHELDKTVVMPTIIVPSVDTTPADALELLEGEAKAKTRAAPDSTDAIPRPCFSLLFQHLRECVFPVMFGPGGDGTPYTLPGWQEAMLEFTRNALLWHRRLAEVSSVVDSLTPEMVALLKQARPRESGRVFPKHWYISLEDRTNFETKELALMMCAFKNMSLVIGIEPKLALFRAKQTLECY